MPFERTCIHRDWVDGEDIVQAGSSPNDEGFNARFHKIEADLDALGGYVNRSLLGDRVVSLVPDFSSGCHYDESAAWVLGRGEAILRATQTTAYGFLPLSLPDGASMVELRVCGYVAANAYILFDLYRRAHLYNSPREALIQQNYLYGEMEFDERMQILAGGENDIVNNGLYHYFLYATGQRANDSLEVEIHGISIQYTFDP